MIIVVPILLASFFVIAIGTFCIKQKYYENTIKKYTPSYRPLLDDSFTETGFV